MLGEDFGSEADEYDAAEGLDSAFEEVAEPFSYVDAEIGEDEGYNADDCDGQRERGDDEGKGNSDGEGVDAGGYGQGEQDKELGGVWVLPLRL